MNNPKISIIIPVYNVEKYLRECLDSVANQTFRDIEIICVDDGSTDSSPAILDEYAANDSRFVVIHQENAWQATARNNGMAAAKGEYIFFMDSNDVIALDTLEMTYQAAEESGSEMVMFYMYCYPADAEVPVKAPCPISEPVTDLYNKTQLVFFQGPSAWKWLYKKAYLDRLNLRYITGIQFEDTAFAISAALHSNSITVVPRRFYYYRQIEGTSTRKCNDYYCRYSWLIYQHAYQSVQDLPLNDASLQLLYKNKLQLIWNGYCNRTPKELLGQFRENIKNSAFPHEYEWVKANKLGLTNQQRKFFVGVYGSPFAKFLTSLKIAKESFADWLAKRLVSHSPWLQHMCQIIDRQNEEF